MKYAKNFNHKRNPTEHVFQGRHDAKRVLDDKYLGQFVGYIHRNPVEAERVESVTNYEWSP